MSGSGQNHPSSGNAPATSSDPSMEDILASIRRILSEDDGGASRKAAAPVILPQPVAQPTPPPLEPPTPAATPEPAAFVAPAAPVAPVFNLDESMLVRPQAAAPGNASSSLAALGNFMSASTQPKVVPTQPAAVATPAPQPSPVSPAPAPSPMALEPTPALQPAPAPKVQIAPQPQTEPVMTPHDELSAHAATLVAPEAAAAAAASMGNLMRTLSAERHTSVYRGGPTLEDLVRDEMRPMLKEWLDANVPAMVERIVRSEIERMAGRVAI